MKDFEFNEPWISYAVPEQFAKRYMIDMSIAFFIVFLFGAGLATLLWLVIISDVFFWYKLKLYDEHKDDLDEL